MWRRYKHWDTTTSGGLGRELRLHKLSLMLLLEVLLLMWLWLLLRHGIYRLYRGGRLRLPQPVVLDVPHNTHHPLPASHPLLY